MPASCDRRSMSPKSARASRATAAVLSVVALAAVAGAPASAMADPSDVGARAPVGQVSVGPMTWSDEFDGTTLDPTRWSHRATGPRGDGVLTPDAVSVGNGALTIKTYTEAGKHYSGMISTQANGSNGFEQAYGYYEARVKFNDAPGQWSAFWLQSPTIGGTLGDPATAGVEMDVAEHRARCVTAPLPALPATCAADNDISNRTQRALIWDGYGADRKSTARLSDPLAGLANDTWHTWGLRWTPTDATFYYDGAAIWSTTGPISHRSEYVILSSEVSQQFAGAIPASGYGSRETSTTNMQVDYVRVWGAAPTQSTPAPAPDTTPPSATLSVRASQKLGAAVRVTISCPEESCQATATGIVRVPKLARTPARTYRPVATATLAKGAQAAVRLALSTRARAAIARALQARRRVVVKLGVRVADRAGNIAIGTRRVTLKR